MPIPKFSFKGLSAKEIEEDQNDPKWEPVFRWLGTILVLSIIFGAVVPLALTAKEHNISIEMLEEVAGPNVGIIATHIANSIKNILIFVLIVPTILYAALQFVKHGYYFLEDRKLRKDPNLIRRRDYRSVAVMLKELEVIQVSENKDITVSPSFDLSILPPVGKRLVKYVFGKEAKAKHSLDSFILKSQEAIEEVIGDRDPHIALIRTMLPENKNSIQRADLKSSTKTFLHYFLKTDRKHSRLKPFDGLLDRIFSAMYAIARLMNPKKF